LLVKGPRGIGKQAFGMALANALLCETPPAQRHGLQPVQCLQLVRQWDAPRFSSAGPRYRRRPGRRCRESAKKTKASPWISIEQVRELHDFINVSSHRGGRKIILVNPAEALNVNAATPC